MRMLCWNVNGLRSILRKGFMGWLKSEDADIVCLQETKVGEDQVPPSIRHFPGYHS